MFSLSKLGSFARTYRHLNRYNRIMQVLLKYGFSDLISRLHIDQYLESGWQLISGKQEESVERLSRPERLRLAFEELGPTFIKFGQLLSSRPDLISPAYQEELAKLQDNIPPADWAAIQAVFLREFAAPPDQVFAFFDENPIAAASIGQVYQARLHSGQDVVVKVRRPGITQLIQVDLEIFAHIAALMEQYLEEFQGHAPSAVVEEFAVSLNQEIDFTIELVNIQRFALQFKDRHIIHVPAVYPEICSSRILVMEQVKGIKVSDLKALREGGYNLSLIAERGATLVMEQIFQFGFFHADPHPGNLFILPDNIICFIDFGQMGRLSRKDREDFTLLIGSMIKRDDQLVLGYVLKTTVQLGEVNRESLTRDLNVFMDRYLYLPLEKVEATKLLQDLLSLVARHKLSFKPSLYLMMKALSTVEGVGLMLDPKLELFRLAKPFMRRLQMERLRPNRLLEEFSQIGGSYLQLLKVLPNEVNTVLEQLRRGKFRLGFEHHGIKPLQITLERVSNRIAYAIVLAALIMGSSLIVLSGIPPHWHGIPVIGLIGFLLAAFMGFGLLISILRHGKM